jgi:hypothetical protein
MQSHHPPLLPHLPLRLRNPHQHILIPDRHKRSKRLHRALEIRIQNDVPRSIDQRRRSRVQDIQVRPAESLSRRRRTVGRLVAEQHKHIPHAQLRGERHAHVEEREVPAGAVGGAGDAEFFEAGRDVAAAQPLVFEFLQGGHEAVEAGAEELFEAAELPQADEHDKGALFVEVAEEGRGETGHALDVARVGAVEGDGVQDPEEQALAAAVALAEHDVHADGPGDVHVDLHVVCAVELLQAVEVADEFVVGGMWASATGRSAHETMPRCSAPTVWNAFPRPADELAVTGVEVEAHTATSAIGAFAGHLEPFFVTRPFFALSPVESLVAVLVFGNIC